MRSGSLHMRARARALCAALGLWGMCALAAEAPASAPPQAAPPAAASEPRPGAPSSGDPRVDDLGGPGLEPTDFPEGESMGWALLRTVIVLGVVLGLVYLTLNVGLRRLMGLRPGIPGREPLVSVMERIPLDPKRSLFVLKAAGEYLLVGGGEGSLNLICKLDPAEVARIERERAASGPPAISPFLQKLLSRRGGSPPPSA